MQISSNSSLGQMLQDDPLKRQGSVLFSESFMNMVNSNSKLVDVQNSPAYAESLGFSEGVSKTLLNFQESTAEASTLQQGVNLDAYFSNDIKASPLGDVSNLPEFLAPSAQNIKQISEHVSGRMKNMLFEYNIPKAPATIRFDNEGNMVLPEDYPYKDEFMEMMEENPGLERELSTLDALTSHYVELQKLAPFHEEMAAAKTQSEIDFIIKKFSHLLNDNRKNSQISMHFDASGNVSMHADGQPVQLNFEG